MSYKPATRIEEKLSKSVFGSLILRYIFHSVPTRSAALAYYLVFSMFPLLILTANAIGLLNINLVSLSNGLRSFLPIQMVRLITDYIWYVEQVSSKTMLVFALVFSIYFPWRAVRGLMKDVRDAYTLPPVKSRVRWFLKELLCTFIMPLALLVTLLLIVFGRNVIIYLVRQLPPDTIDIGSLPLTLWEFLRFAIAAVIMALALSCVYQLSLDQHAKWSTILPGVCLAIAAWLLSSMVFSFYVENFANYSVIYGTLGGFMILLLWLWLSSMIFIMGSEFNALLSLRRRRKALDKTNDAGI